MTAQQINDGGPAFPTESAGQTGTTTWRFEGMTLRDYFAVHSTQPGVAEIAKAAGIGYDGTRVYPTQDHNGMRFNDWWNTLTLAQQCDLSAQVRFAQADAMLRVRESA